MENVPFDIQEAEIMKNFDFDKVHKVMTFLDWRWVDWHSSLDPSLDYVPSVEEIRLSAKTRMRDAWNRYCQNHETSFSSSGGLEAMVVKGMLSLKFVVSDWESDYLFEQMES